MSIRLCARTALAASDDGDIWMALVSLVPEILGGMFGVQHLCQSSRILRKLEFDKILADFGPNWTKQYDQYALRDIVAPHAALDSLVHDSYKCQSGLMPGSKIVPFPSKRPPMKIKGVTVPNFVGNQVTYGIEIECPVACRPKEHQDWKTC